MCFAAADARNFHFLANPSSSLDKKTFNKLELSPGWTLAGAYDVRKLFTASHNLMLVLRFSLFLGNPSLHSLRMFDMHFALILQIHAMRMQLHTIKSHPFRAEP